MKKLLIVLDDETASLLANDKNKSETVREAIKYIKLDITPDTVDGLRKTYLTLIKAVREMDSKIDYLAKSGGYKAPKRRLKPLKAGHIMFPEPRQTPPEASA